MPNPHGSFIWYELMTTDAAAAGRFYGEVVGWTVGERGVSGVSDYRIFSAGEAAVAGLMTLPAGAAEGGMRPGWFGYIGVDDVDAAVAGITAAGGAIHMPAMDLPGVGRLAMVADPQGRGLLRHARCQRGREFIVRSRCRGPLRLERTRPPATFLPPSPSTPTGSAGPGATPWTWAPWANTGSSITPAKGSAP